MDNNFNYDWHDINLVFHEILSTLYRSIEQDYIWTKKNCILDFDTYYYKTTWGFLSTLKHMIAFHKLDVKEADDIRFPELYSYKKCTQCEIDNIYEAFQDLLRTIYDDLPG